MGADDLLPYPLAGADTRPGAVDGARLVEHRTRRLSRILAPVAVVLIVGLLVSLTWTWRAWQSEQAQVEALRAELRTAQQDAAQEQQAAQDAVSDPLTVAEAFSPEMVVASVAVERFVDAVGDDPARADARVFTTAFFGLQMRTTGWTRLEGRTGVSGVLARLDNAAQPALVWVSRRSAQTIDPSAPSRQNCLQLDVGAVVESVAAGREWGRGADRAPLRWWADAYDFVPAEQCGV